MLECFLNQVESAGERKCMKRRKLHQDEIREERKSCNTCYISLFFSLSLSLCSFFSNFFLKKKCNECNSTGSENHIFHSLLKPVERERWMEREKSQLSPLLSSSIFLPWFLIFLTDVNWKQKKIFDRRKKNRKKEKNKGR